MKKNDWSQLLNSPYIIGTKKFLFEIIKDKYPKHEEIIEKLANVITTEKDYKAFAELIVETFEIAYLRAVEDHKKELAKMGYKVTITGEKPKAENIFNRQKNQVDTQKV